jgi:hypothetical protein
MANDPERDPQRIARNQALYRSVNEQIEALNQAFDEAVGIGGSWICECADTNCTEMITARLDEYEKVRQNPRRFLVRPGHVYPEAERVVDETETYAVVEKTGAAARIVEEVDPRTTT